MRRAIAEAEVGDDVFADDPTVRLLEEETARLLGKEAALFVPSGCMGNEIAVSVQTKRGDRIALAPHSHLVLVESRAVAEMMGRQFQILDSNDRGRLCGADVASVLERDADRPALLEAENTFNWHSGSVYSLSARRSVRPSRGARRSSRRRARRLAESLSEISPFAIEPDDIETNIVIARATREPERIGAFLDAAKRRGVLALAFGGPGAIRAITHLDVDDAGIERAAVAFREAAAETWGRTV